MLRTTVAARRIVMVVLAATAMLLGAAAPSCAEPPHHPGSIAFLYPISTNQNPDLYVVVQLSALYSRVGSVRTLGLNGVASRVSGDVHGLQATGIYSQVGGEVRGIQATGALNYVSGDARGLQLAGIGSVDRTDVRGIAGAGLFNVAIGNLHGAQFAGLLNIAGGTGSFLQASGFANSSGGDFQGWQLTGGYNFVSGEMSGLQTAIVNMAVTARGVQLGFANFSTETHGLQVGALNFLGEEHGVPVGMVNLAKNGTSDWIAYGSNQAAVNVGVRTTVRRFYSMLTAGFPDLEDDVPKTLVLTWNYGYAVVAGGPWGVGLDLGFAHYIPTELGSAGENDKLHFALQARGLVERRLNPKWSIFGGGGVAKIYSEYSLGAPANTQGIFFGGVSVR
jgi:hypothetical protein